jgi:hypothetical protein
MSPRERQTPEGGPAAADRLASAPPALAAPESCPGSLWEELLHAADPAQRQQLLELAARQGVLYTPQITPPPNGSLKPIQRPLLAALLAGPVPHLEPVRLVPGEPLDSALDSAQREAVDRALGTPDLCLIQGGPGTGKSRVIAEIVARAAQRGQRVLLLAPSPAALDRVLERLESHEGLCPVRCLGPDEAPEALAPCVRRLTYAERLRSFREQTLAQARQAADAARQTLQRLRADESFGPRLEELARRYEGLTRQVQALSERRTAVATEVDAVAAYLLAGSPPDPGSPFQTRFAACARAWDETRTSLDARSVEIRADANKVCSELETLTKELERLRPLTEAKQAGRWWTGAWWRATFHAAEIAHFDNRIARHHDLETERDRLASETEELTRACTEAETRMAAEQDRLTETEKCRRRSDLDDQIASLEQEQRLFLDKWQTLWQEFGSGPCPTPSGDAVRNGLAARDQKLREADQERTFAEDWACCLEETLNAAPGRLSVFFNVVAATTTALPLGEEILGNSRPIPFDLLILDEAEQVTESEFLQAARGATRWILVGAAGSEERGGTNPEQRKTKQAAGRSVVLDQRPSMFQRLWQRLHPDLRSLPYRWSRSDSHLHCRLRSVPADLERWVESEPVIDRPEIVLRIVATPGKPSQLAEVVFPGSTTIEQAKLFVYQELEEPPLQVQSPYFRWSEGPNSVELLFDPAPSESVALPLGPGVMERVAVADPRHAPGLTISLHFDRSAGLDREKAERWVEEHFGIRDSGRTAFLAVPHRAHPALARILTDLLPASHFPRTGRSEMAPDCTWGGSVFELVAVPPLTDDAEASRHAESEARRRKGGTATAPRLRTGRGGAGLEVDLADSRPLEQLPAELRAALPREGLINYFEARAVVRYLEGLLTDQRFRAAALEWRRKAGCLGNPIDCESASLGTVAGCRPVHSPIVAVMTPYVSQAELIRLLIAQSHALAMSDVRVEIGLPTDFRQRECLVGLVSLTRSHTHRAVTYGEGPGALALALTRAAGRLVVFADPGTLARRTVWQGAVDHLGEAAAASERELATRLLRLFSSPACESGRA